jgi:membrane protein DedA with SNARE-associated domain/rhodanese-related sulfurtransferase
MTGATQLTYSGIGAAVFAQQFCLPVPAMLLLMTAGALAAHGSLHLSLVLLAGVLGCLAADGFWFWLGRRWGSHVIRLVCSFTSDPKASREKAHMVFNRWGLKLLLIAKFVPGLDGVSPPLAGAEGATVRGFLAYDTAGSLLWNGFYVLLGFTFSGQLDRVMRVVERFGTVFAVVLGVPFVVWAAWRLLQLVRMIRHLRLRRMSPALLQEKMAADDRLVIFDLLDYEARIGEIAGIPGAVRVDPTRMRTSPKLDLPEGMSVVLYCSSRGELASARVSEALRNRGMENVWVLEGGLEAWTQEGRPVTTKLSTPEEILKRMGVALPADWK